MQVASAGYRTKEQGATISENANTTANLSLDGAPSGSVTYVYDELNRLVSVVDQKPKRTVQLRRLENVRRNPDVQLVVDHYDDDWSALWWVRISGRGHVLDRGSMREEAVDLLASKYAQYREQRPTGPVLVIDITRIDRWQATIG